MYRPSMYNKHDESMYTFAELFNNCKVCNDVIMKPNDEETYGNDGYFIHSNGQKIGYDWEYRDRYFSNCRLQFDTLGQYERKLRKDCIQIAGVSFPRPMAAWVDLRNLQQTGLLKAGL